jgi:WD40 repeat protein
VRSFSDLGWGVESLAFSPNGTHLAAGKMDRALLMFDVVNSARLAKLDGLEILGQVPACVFTPGGERLLAGGYSGHIQIWEVSKEGQLRDGGQFAGHSQEVKAIAVSSDSRYALSGGAEKKVRFWQIDNGKELAVFTGFQGPVKACWLAPNGKTGLATDGATLLHLDLQKMEVAKTSQLTRSWASGQSAAISPDGSLVTVGDSYNMRLWEVKTMKELPKLESNDIQWSATFTPDGTRLITGASSKINIWDVRKQQRMVALECPNGYIKSVAASPDNKYVAAISGNAGSTLRVFRIPLADK